MSLGLARYGMLESGPAADRGFEDRSTEQPLQGAHMHVRDPRWVCSWASHMRVSRSWCSNSVADEHNTAGPVRDRPAPSDRVRLWLWLGSAPVGS